MELSHYNGYVKKQIGLVERRLLKGETIQAKEKIYSIFEVETNGFECILFSFSGFKPKSKK